MRFTSILVFVACFASSVQAEDSPVSNTWLDTFIRSFSAAPEPWGTVQQVFGINIGGHDFIFEAVQLEEIAELLNTEAHYWEAPEGGAIEWSCLSRGSQTLWIYADTAMGAGTVSGIGIDMRDPAPPSAGCGVWPTDLTVDIGVMGVGMPADVIAANYLTGQPDEYGIFGAINQIEHPGEPAFTTMEELTFRANEEGFIDAVAVMQMTD
ncbi:MAG: hypothetical protein EOP20_05525 [Hyphomicrobiales bacterium]|nr:MAG: hypothetical protein EOP20_05525 [Hyphomicrobiales bacterium]